MYLVGFSDGRAAVIDLRTGAVSGAVLGPLRSAPTSLAISPSGLAAIGSATGELHLFHPENYAFLAEADLAHRVHEWLEQLPFRLGLPERTTQDTPPVSGVQETGDLQPPAAKK